MKKPLIAHVVRTDGWAGTEQALASYIRHTGDRFDHVIVSTSATNPDTKDRYGAPVVNLASVYPEASDRQLIADLTETLHDLAPDTVCSWMQHCHHFAAKAVEKGGLDTGLVWYEHDTRIPAGNANHASQQRFRENAAMSHHVPYRTLYCSEPVRDTHVAHGYSDEKSAVVPVGIDLGGMAFDAHKREELRNALGLKESDTVLGFVARYSKQKDFPAFIKLARTVKAQCLEAYEPVPHFLVCGTGTGRDNAELTAMLAEAGLADNVHLLGLRQDMQAVWTALYANLSTSHYETQGLACLEGMAAGYPFVGTDVGVHRHLVADEARIFPPRPLDGDINEWDVAPMAQAVRGIMNNLPHYRQVTADSHTIGDYDIREAATRFADVMEVSVRHRAPAPGQQSTLGR